MKLGTNVLVSFLCEFDWANSEISLIIQGNLQGQVRENIIFNKKQLMGFCLGKSIYCIALVIQGHLQGHKMSISRLKM